MTAPMIPHSRPSISLAEIKAVSGVVKSGQLIGPDQSGTFAAMLGRGTPSGQSGALFPTGRAAVRSCLEALRLPPGSGVVVQTYVCDAVLWAIEAAGYRPVLCDIGDGWTCGPAQVASVLDPQCRALVLAPPFGFRQCATPFAQFELPIVHDLCQASPGLPASGIAGELGELVALSFHPTKYLCAAGGGAALDLTGRYVADLRNSEKYVQQFAPFGEMQAAIGIEQLRRLGEFRARRRSIANSYLSRAPTASIASLLACADVDPGDMLRLPFDTGGRDLRRLFESFAQRGITARHGVDQLAHRLLGLDDKTFTNAVRAFENTLSLPFYPALADRDVERVAGAIEEVLA